MPKPAFNPNQRFESVQPEKPAFNPDADFDRDEMGFFDKWESYTTAPVRAAIDKAQRGGGALDAVKTYFSELGEDPRNTPEFKELLEKAGVSDASLNKGGNRYTSHKSGISIPVSEDDAPSISGALGAGAEMIADPTNLIPGALVAKGVKGTAQGIRAAAKTASRLSGADWFINQVGKLGKKGFSAAFGVPEETVDAYLKNHDRLKGLDADDALKTLQSDVDETLLPLRENVERGKEKLSTLKDSNKVQRLDAKDALDEAKVSFQRAQEQAIRGTAPKLSRGVQELGDLVKKGSSESFNILDEAGATYNTSKLKADLSRTINMLEQNKATDADEALIAYLKRFRDRVGKFDKEIPASQAKSIIQKLDDELGSIEDFRSLRGKDKITAGIRGSIDQSLKSVPEYRSKMADVARKTRLLKKLRKMGLVDEQGAINALSNVDSLGKTGKRNLIQSLESELGKSYLNPVAGENLPEFERMKRLMAQYDQLKRGDDIRAAEQSLDAAKGELAPFEKIAPDAQGYSRADSRIKNLLRPNDRNAATEQMFSAMDEKFGKDFSQRAEDIRTVRGFDKEFTRGSANTNFWTVVGGVLGSSAGPGGTVMGGLGGAAAGRLLFDKYGPQVARAILDQTAALKKMAPTQWIESLNVPVAVKRDLMKDYVLANVARKSVSEGERSLPKVAGSEEEGQRRPALIPEEEAQRRFIEGN